MSDDSVMLWRPVGTKELALVEASDWRVWPPRLPEQPIFYPVTNEVYAQEIARDWNTKFDDRIGHVTRFRLKKSFLDRFEKQVVGGRRHEEYWIPAELLDELNRNIVGRIELTATYTEQDRHERESKGIVDA